MSSGPATAARAGATPAGLLSEVASALSACLDAGMTVRLHHGAVETAEGYVLRVGDAYVARTRAYTPFTPPLPADGLDD